MVYRRFQGRRRKRSRFSRYAGTAGRALATAGSALALAKSVKALLNVEYKIFHVELPDVEITSAGASIKMTGVAEGDDDSDRNGRSLRAKKFNMSWRMVINSGGDDVQFCRIVVVQDMHQEGVLPTWLDVFQSNDVNTFRNIDNTDRFKILMDKKVVMHENRPGLFRKANIKLDTKVEYIGTDGGQASQGAGNIYFMHISEQIGANYPLIDLHTRFRYIDN